MQAAFEAACRKKRCGLFVCRGGQTVAQPAQHFRQFACQKADGADLRLFQQFCGRPVQPHGGRHGFGGFNALCQQAGNHAGQHVAAARGGQPGVAGGVGVQEAACG